MAKSKPEVSRSGEKLDLYRAHKEEYQAAREPALIAVGPAWYLAIEGQGEPGGEAFQEAIGALYGAAFTIKMTRKFAGLGDYKVCALEGLWWTEKDGRFSCDAPRSQWRWKLLIRTPDFIKPKDLEEAKAALRKKGKGPATERVALEKIEEGRCVQVLHVGPYGEEPATIEKMHQFAKEQGLAIHGIHHEIYLNDPRRVAPDRLKTILRQPVK